MEGFCYTDCMEKQRTLRIIAQLQPDQTYRYRVLDLETDEEIRGVESVRLHGFNKKRPELHLELSEFAFETIPPDYSE